MGSTNDVPYLLAERWNGRTWTLERLANSPAAGLSGVSCTSSRTCTAVGSHFNPKLGCDLPLIERWDGHLWSIKPLPDPTGGTCEFDTRLNGVSCASSRCIAVGEEDASVSGPYAQVWRGTAWSELDPPDVLKGVSCRAGACTAVGDLGAVDRWNGTTWSRQPTNLEADLNGISCPSATACFAVGSDYSDHSFPIVAQGP